MTPLTAYEETENPSLLNKNMSIFKHIICKWKGHVIDINFFCERCHREVDYVEYNKDTIRERVMAHCKRLKTWWKCEECGRRFGKHDDGVDHIPF